MCSQWEIERRVRHVKERGAWNGRESVRKKESQLEGDNDCVSEKVSGSERERD